MSGKQRAAVSRERNRETAALFNKRIIRIKPQNSHPQELRSHVFGRVRHVLFQPPDDDAQERGSKVSFCNLPRNGCVIGMKYVIPEMQKAGGGSIINISSIGGIVGMAGTSPYTAAKGALRVLSKSAAVEYGKDRIRVNSLHPGIVVTPMTLPSMEEGGAIPYYQAHTQLPYFGEPEDIAYGALYLASDESRFMTGAELVIDGGWTAL